MLFIFLLFSIFGNINASLLGALGSVAGGIFTGMGTRRAGADVSAGMRHASAELARSVEKLADAGLKSSELMSKEFASTMIEATTNLSDQFDESVSKNIEILITSFDQNVNKLSNLAQDESQKWLEQSVVWRFIISEMNHDWLQKADAMTFLAKTIGIITIIILFLSGLGNTMPERERERFWNWIRRSVSKIPIAIPLVIILFILGAGLVQQVRISILNTHLELVKLAAINEQRFAALENNSYMQQNTFYDTIPVGTIIASIVSSPDLPQNFLPCDGRRLNTKEYPKLATIMQASTQSITLPDLRGRTLLGAGNAAATGISSRVLHETGGQESITLTTAHLPPHQHESVWFESFPHVGPPQHMSEARDMYKKYADHPKQHVTGKTGEGKPHTNMPPWYALNFIIKVKEQIALSTAGFCDDHLYVLSF